MYVCLDKPWNYLPIGRVVEVTEGVADVLVNRRKLGHVVESAEKPPGRKPKDKS